MNVTPWIKARRSADSGQCVELRRNDQAVEVRDSKNPAGATLRSSTREFSSWLEGAKKGEFDHLR